MLNHEKEFNDALEKEVKEVDIFFNNPENIQGMKNKISSKRITKLTENSNDEVEKVVTKK